MPSKSRIHNSHICCYILEKSNERVWIYRRLKLRGGNITCAYIFYLFYQSCIEKKLKCSNLQWFKGVYESWRAEFFVVMYGVFYIFCLFRSVKHEYGLQVHWTAIANRREKVRPAYLRARAVLFPAQGLPAPGRVLPLLSCPFFLRQRHDEGPIRPSYKRSYPKEGDPPHPVISFSTVGVNRWLWYGYMYR